MLTSDLANLLLHEGGSGGEPYLSEAGRRLLALDKTVSDLLAAASEQARTSEGEFQDCFHALPQRERSVLITVVNTLWNLPSASRLDVARMAAEAVASRIHFKSPNGYRTVLPLKEPSNE